MGLGTSVEMSMALPEVSSTCVGTITMTFIPDSSRADTYTTSPILAGFEIQNDNSVKDITFNRDPVVYDVQSNGKFPGGLTFTYKESSPSDPVKRWIDNHVYAGGSKVKDPSSTWQFYTASGGTSGASEPDWESHFTVTDGGGVQWELVEFGATKNWAPGLNPTPGDIYWVLYSFTNWKCVSGGTTAEPPPAVSDVTDGSVTWSFSGKYSPAPTGSILLDMSTLSFSQAVVDSVWTKMTTKLFENYGISVPGTYQNSHSINIIEPEFKITYDGNTVTTFGHGVNSSEVNSTSTIYVERKNLTDAYVKSTTTSTAAYSEYLNENYYNTHSIAVYPKDYSSLNYTISKTYTASDTVAGGGGFTQTYGSLNLVTNIITNGVYNTVAQQLTSGNTTSTQLYGPLLWNWGLSKYGNDNNPQWIGFLDFAFTTYNDEFAPYNSADLINGNNFHVYSSDNLTDYNCRYFPDGSTFTTAFGGNYSYADRSNLSIHPTYYIGTTG